jgi:hypothetical protein
MELEKMIALANAGYTKQEIETLLQQNMTQPIVPQQNIAQPIVPQQIVPQQNMTQPIVPQQIVPQQNMTQPIVPQPIANGYSTPQYTGVDYKALYETQKKMLEDMQTLNTRLTKGQPIDTVDSVVNDFLGGSK